MSRQAREDEKLVDDTIRLIREGHIPFVMFGWVLFAEERCCYIGPLNGRLAIQTDPPEQQPDIVSLVFMDSNLRFINTVTHTRFDLEDVATREGRDLHFPVCPTTGAYRSMTMCEYMPREDALRQLRDYICPCDLAVIDSVARHLPVVGVPELIASFLGEMPPEAARYLAMMTSAQQRNHITPWPLAWPS